MADFNINAQCQSNSKNFPRTQQSMSFHAAQPPVTISFNPNPNCFGSTTSITLTATNPTQSLTVSNPVTTTFQPSCSNALDTYDITFTGPEGGKNY